MNFPRNILLLLVISLSLTSCLITNDVRTMKVEIMKPGIFNIPRENTVAIVNRDLFKTDTCTFRYSNGILKVEDYSGDNSSFHSEEILYEIKTDTSIHYANLSDTCVHVLSDYLKEIGYFCQVVEPNDSIYQLITIPGIIETPKELFLRTKTDVFIFLDYFKLKTTYNKDQSIPFQTKAKLIWTVIVKSDSLAYTYNQVDTLLYDRKQITSYSRNKDKILSHFVNNSSIYLGNSFGTKMIPTWIPAERAYYKSKNRNMLEAERFAIKQDWLKAAEIWNKETKK